MAPLTNLTPREIIFELPYGWGRQIVAHWFQSKGVKMFRHGWQRAELVESYLAAVGNLPHRR